jgi:DNA polymerase-3 subunit delta'
VTAVPVDAPPPRQTEELLGHTRAEQTILMAVRSGRMPHAWLIGGPEGVGKATLAYRFARFMLAGAPEGATLHVPSDHPTSRRVASGGHADLVTIERPPAEPGKRRPAEIPVDEVRRASPFLRLTPAEGGWRVAIIDEADRLNRSSANALLKILEEPPQRALIILIAASPGALLPTIRSRCRRLMLGRLDDEAVEAWLAARAPSLPPGDRQAVARLAEGSVGRAARLVEGDGLDLYRWILGLLAGLPRLDLLETHRLAERLGGFTAEPAWRMASELLDGWLMRLVGAMARGRPAVEAVGGEGEVLARCAALAGLDRWVEVWEKTHRLLASVDEASLDRRQIVLQAFLSLQAATKA